MVEGLYCHTYARCVLYTEPRQVACECNPGFYGDGVTICDPIDGSRQSPEGENLK